MTDLSIQNLSKLTIFSKYAKYIEKEKRRESWEEIVDRVQDMHIKKFPELKDDIKNAFQFVIDKKVVPSMRSMQFGGKPIEINNSRLYNCSYTPIEKPKDFSEIIFLLLSGCGVGISVQKRHIEKLPPIIKPLKGRKFVVGDSIEGWSDAIRALFKAYFKGGTKPLFDYSDIRAKGLALKTAGGKAPGPEPLRRCINKIESILESKNNGEKLKTIEVHDIVCIIADAVLSGGIRRSSIISLFDKADEDMLNCKGNFSVQIWNGGFHYNPQKKCYEGEVIYKNKAHFISLNEYQFKEFQNVKTLPWYYFEPQRARANNSVVLKRDETTYEDFHSIFEIIRKSGAGEPGFFWTNDYNYGTNPCLIDNTLISTENGMIRLDKIIQMIEDDVQLPKIYSYNIKENKIEKDIIVNGALTHKKANIIRITLENGDNLDLTPDHKIFTRNRGWIEAGKLTENDILIKID